MVGKIVLGAVVATVVAVADDLPWRFDGDVTRDATNAVAVVADVSAPMVMTVEAGAALPTAFDSAEGFSWRASDALAIFDSRPATGMVFILR